MKHIYPPDVVTEDQKRAWRRNARKQARSEGTYVPENRAVAVSTSTSTPRPAHNSPTGELTCTSCGFRFLYGNVPHYHEGKPYHKTCHPDFPVPQNYLNTDFTPQSLPDALLQIAFSQGLKIDQVLPMFKDWGKPHCPVCKKYMVPWQEIYQFEPTAGTQLLAHLECGQSKNWTMVGGRVIAVKEHALVMTDENSL